MLTITIIIPRIKMDHDDNIFNPTGMNDFEQEIQEFKSLDAGYNKIYTSGAILGKNGKYKRKKIEFYASGDRGSRIRDAVTGSYYNAKVGSYSEDNFFKVSVSTGQCSNKSGLHTLFYQTPTQYNSHFMTQLSPAIVEKWNIKQQSAEYV